MHLLLPGCFPSRILATMSGSEYRNKDIIALNLFPLLRLFRKMKMGGQEKFEIFLLPTPTLSVTLHTSQPLEKSPRSAWLEAQALSAPLLRSQTRPREGCPALKRIVLGGAQNAGDERSCGCCPYRGPPSLPSAGHRSSRPEDAAALCHPVPGMLRGRGRASGRVEGEGRPWEKGNKRKFH